MGDLCKEFTAALGEAGKVADNCYLKLLEDKVRFIEDYSSNSYVEKSIRELSSIIKQEGFALNGESTNKFAQLLGETYFYCICVSKGLSIEKVPESSDSKTPDFCICLKDKNEVFFEVKTLSVVDGGRQINRHLEDTLDAKINIDEQLHSGKNIAFSETEIQPYSSKQNSITTIINTLIEKSRQNIKEDQFKLGPTFLVLDLSLIPPFRTDQRTLRSAYCQDSLVITGDLWMLAFGEIGMLIHGFPDFEGKPCIEGKLDKIGLLQEHLFIKGLLVVVHPLGNPIKLFGLLRENDTIAWQDSQSPILDILNKITDENINDDKDSFAWKLCKQDF